MHKGIRNKSRVEITIMKSSFIQIQYSRIETDKNKLKISSFIWIIIWVEKSYFFQFIQYWQIGGKRMHILHFATSNKKEYKNLFREIFVFFLSVLSRLHNFVVNFSHRIFISTKIAFFVLRWKKNFCHYFTFCSIYSNLIRIKFSSMWNLLQYRNISKVDLVIYFNAKGKFLSNTLTYK